MYPAAYYTSKKKLTVIKTLETATATGIDGKTISRVYGTWATDPKCMITFEPGEKVYLDKNTANLPNVKSLIQAGIITRTF